MLSTRLGPSDHEVETIIQSRLKQRSPLHCVRRRCREIAIDAGSCRGNFCRYVLSQMCQPFGCGADAKRVGFCLEGCAPWSAFVTVMRASASCVFGTMRVVQGDLRKDVLRLATARLKCCRMCTSCFETLSVVDFLKCTTEYDACHVRRAWSTRCVSLTGLITRSSYWNSH